MASDSAYALAECSLLCIAQERQRQCSPVPLAQGSAVRKGALRGVHGCHGIAEEPLIPEDLKAVVLIGAIR